jgi:hypothetical protein
MPYCKVDLGTELLISGCHRATESSNSSRRLFKSRMQAAGTREIILLCRWNTIAGFTCPKQTCTPGITARPTVSAIIWMCWPSANGGRSSLGDPISRLIMLESGCPESDQVGWDVSQVRAAFCTTIATMCGSPVERYGRRPAEKSQVVV